MLAVAAPEGLFTTQALEKLRKVGEPMFERILPGDDSLKEIGEDDPQSMCIEVLTDGARSDEQSDANLAEPRGPDIERPRNRTVGATSVESPGIVETMIPQGMEDENWITLCGRLARDRCVPIVGAGASHPWLPLGGQLAAWLSDKKDYPFKDDYDLPRVAQFIHVMDDPLVLRDLITQRFDSELEKLPEEYRDVASAPYNRPYDPTLTLARLPLSVYITTNYDDLLQRALRSVGKHPVTVDCRWREDDSGYDALDPTVNEPVVFYLHGSLGYPGRMVVSESDYLEFLVRLSTDGQNRSGTGEDRILPEAIRDALQTKSMLFVGYSLQDWNFRLLARSILKSRVLRPRSVAIQFPPGDIKEGRDHEKRAGRYLDKALREITGLNVDTVFTDAYDFMESIARAIPDSLRAVDP